MNFSYDVFLSHSSKDTQVVRKLAQRLKSDGLRVWFDEWEIKPPAPIWYKIQVGLQASRNLVLVISKNGMGSKWAMMETGAFLDRDPTNKKERFIPLRLDNTQSTSFINQFSCVDWRKESPEEYAELFKLCRPKKRNAISIHISDITSARIYDYLLGGHYNTISDQVLAKQLLKKVPNLKKIMISNRAFLRRSLHFLIKAGIRQFIDIGSGLPTRGNTHEVVRKLGSDAKVVYVDYDKQVFEASRNLMGDESNVQVVLGDLTKPRALLSASGLKVIDFRKPVAILLVAVLHFVTNDKLALKSIRAFKRKMVPGSYLVISHASRPTGTTIDKPLLTTYQNKVTDFRIRPRKSVLKFFQGADLVEPGLVFASAWRPDIKDPYLPAQKLPFVNKPEKCLVLAGVGLIRNQ
jgi:hypothetical protein